MIIDPVGAAYWTKHSQCVAMDGRVLHIGFVRSIIDNVQSLMCDPCGYVYIAGRRCCGVC